MTEEIIPTNGTSAEDVVYAKKVKEIYIDGVNVAECKDYREVEYKEMPVCMNYYNHLPKPPKETEWQYCAGNKNCYYKQLKRLEQENKELLETLTKGCYQNLQHECRIWKLKESKYRSALEEIRKLNKHCADCEGNTCGVCAAADGKPNNSYRIANEALK